MRFLNAVFGVFRFGQQRAPATRYLALSMTWEPTISLGATWEQTIALASTWEPTIDLEMTWE